MSLRALRRDRRRCSNKIRAFIEDFSQLHRAKVRAGGTIVASRPWEACEIIMRSIIVYVMAQMRRMQSDRRGVVAVVIALVAIPVLAGFATLAVDTSTWSSSQNSAQGAADNAALSAVVAKGAGSSSTQITNEVLANAALNGFTNGQNGVTVTVNNPPKTGPNTSNSNAYEVIVTKPQNAFFSGLLGTAPTVIGRSVAIVQSGSPACVLALDSSASGAITMSGGASVGAPKCAVAANSSSATAGNFSGGATLTAANFNVVGNYSVSGGATVSATIMTGAPKTTDPYASLAVPSYTVCNNTAYSLSGGTATLASSVDCGAISVSGGGHLTMNPGAYSSITVSGGSTLTMNPGIYVIYGSGGFNLSGGTTTNASGGVSIVLTSNTGSSYGSITISGGATLTLTAPSSGSMQGVAFYVDRNAPKSGSDSFSGGSSMAITGSIYTPSQQATYSGGSSTASVCLQLIADTVNFSGGSSFGVSCGSLTVPGLQPTGGTKGVPAE
jgi:Flp pilus assembly protein TadG